MTTLRDKIPDKKIDNLLTDYWIKYYTKIVKQINEGDESIRDQKVKIIGLDNIFLKRMFMDPRFQSFVLEKVVNNDFVIENIRDYIRNVRGEMDKDTKKMIFNTGDKAISKDTSKKSETEVKTSPPSSFDSIVEIYRKKSLKTENIRKYLFDELRSIKPGEEKYSEKAIQYLLESLDKPHDITILFSPIFPYYYKIENNPSYYRTLEKKYIIKNIKFASKFEEDESFDNRMINQLFYGLRVKTSVLDVLTLTLTESLIRKIFDESIKSNDFSELTRYSNFITDIITISCITWFRNNSLEERIKILNDEYPKNFDMERISLSHVSLDTLRSLVPRYIESGEYNNSEKVLKYLIGNDSSDLHIHYKDLDNLATLYRKKRNFDKAITYYKKALETSKSLTCENREYKRVIELKNLFECHLRSGSKEKADEYLEQIEKDIESLDVKCKAKFLFNLAKSYKRARNFKKEFETLNQLSDIESVKEIIGWENYIYMNNRFILLNKNYNKFDNLVQKVLQEEFKKVISNAYRKLELFQYDEAIHWLEVANTLIPNSEEYYLIMSKIYLWKNDYEKATKHLKMMKEHSPEVRGPNLYLGLIDLKNGNRDMGIQKITAFFNQLFDEAGYNELLNYLKELLRELASKDFDVLDIIFEIGENVTFSKTDFFYNTGKVLSSNKIGFMEEAKVILEKALDQCSEDFKRTQILMEVKKCYYHQGNYNKALNIFDDLIEKHPESDDLFIRGAKILRCLGQKKKALEYLNKVSDIDDDNFRHTKYLIENDEAIISLDLLDNKKSRKFLYSAEKQFFDNIVSKNNDIDVSNLKVEYSKGIEDLFNENIAKKAWEFAVEDNNLSSKTRFIPDEFWRGDKDNGKEPLRGYLKGLRYEKSVSVGKWIEIMDDTNKKNLNNPLNKSFLSYVKNHFTHKERKQLKMYFDFLCEERGPSAHTGEAGIDDLEEIREELIENINSIVYIYYKSKKNLNNLV